MPAAWLDCREYGPALARYYSFGPIKRIAEELEASERKWRELKVVAAGVQAC